MNLSPADQQHVDLYFDAERVKTILSEAYDNIAKAQDAVMHVFQAEAEAQAAGKEPVARLQLDVAARSGLSAGLSLLHPLLRQLYQAAAQAQDVCRAMYPNLNVSSTTH